MQCNHSVALLDLVGVLLRADQTNALSDALHNEGIGDAYAQAMVAGLKLLGDEGIATIAHRFEAKVPAALLALVADETPVACADVATPQCPSEGNEAMDALQLLLRDVEASACGREAYGMPVENEDHPFHVSVLRARNVLARGLGRAVVQGYASPQGGTSVK